MSSLLKEIDITLKDWSAVVDALGEGKQNGFIQN